MQRPPAEHDRASDLSSVSRRRFVTHVAATSAAGVLTGTAATTWAAGPVGLAEATLQDLQPLVGTRFELIDPRGQRAEALLVDARTTAGGHPPYRQPFSLLFQVAGPAPATDQTCQLSHARLGTWDLLLTPVEPGDTGRLEAVFG